MTTKLSKWLEKTGLTVAWLSFETRISYASISKIVKGGRCREATAATIFEAVKGGVPLIDIRDGR